MHCDSIRYTWADRHLSPHTLVRDRPRGKYAQSNTNLSNVILTITIIPHHILQIHMHNTYVHDNFIMSLYSEKWRTYIHSILHAYSVFSHTSGIPNSFIFLLSYLTPRVQIVSFLAHASICTHVLMSFFTIRLIQNSATTLTHVSRYRPFLVNGLYSTTKTSHHHIKRTTSAQLLHFRINIFSPLIIQKIDIPCCQEVQEWDEFTQYVPRTSFPPDLIQSLPTFQLNVRSYSQNPLSCLNILHSFLRQNFCRVFKLPLVDLSSFPLKIFYQFNLTVVELVSR